MLDATTAKQFLDLGGLVVLAGIAIWTVYKLAIYSIAREKENAIILLGVIDKLTSTIERNTESNTKLYEAILTWDRHMRRETANSDNKPHQQP